MTSVVLAFFLLIPRVVIVLKRWLIVPGSLKRVIKKGKAKKVKRHLTLRVMRSVL